MTRFKIDTSLLPSSLSSRHAISFDCSPDKPDYTVIIVDMVMA
jgi:hypothetical protein